MGESKVNLSGAARAAFGFTLLELLVTIAVAAVLLAIAIPSYRGVVQRNAVAAAANDLVGDLNYARSQAVTRGQPVLMCRSNDRTNCDSAGGDWSEGWIVYAPEPGSTDATVDNRLRVKSAIDGQVRITGNGNLVDQAGFDANGFARTPVSFSNGTFTVAATDSGASTDVIIASSGRIRSETTPDNS